MKITSNTIRDLLPLYVEQTTRADSRSVIEGPIEECEVCKSTLPEMTAFGQFPVDTKVTTLLKLKSTLHKKKAQTMIIIMMTILALVVYILAFLTTPDYLPNDKEIVTVNEIGNGSVLIRFGENASGYDLNRTPSEEKGKVVYSLTTWNSMWYRSIAKTPVDNIVLNPSGETIAAVYYYETDGSEDLLIYGKNQISSGGGVTLPRLFLAYYVLIALGLVVICSFIIILFKRHKRVTDLTIKILFLPVSYLIGQFLIKGTKTSSYHALRDYYAILLIMIPLFIAFIMVHNLYKTYRNKTSN